MMISACIITKNEEKNIKRCLESIKNMVDEIVVVDTGSEDSTIDIVRTYTDKVYSYSWNDDFSAVRNFAIEQAVGDYILFLDADESLIEKFNFKTFLRNKEFLEEAYLIKIFNIDLDKSDEVIDEFWAIRFFKNSPNIRYKYKIHEQLFKNNIDELLTGYIEGLSIKHSGYSTTMLPEKAKRNLELLNKELQHNEDKERLYSYLAEVHNYLGNKEMAEHFARLDIGLNKTNLSYASKSYRILIEILKEHINDNDEQLKKILEQAMFRFPNLPDFKAEYALYCYENMEYQKAVTIMKEAVKMAENYTGFEPSVFKNEKIIVAKKFIHEWQKISAEIIKISACVIVRDEEKNINKWLENSAIYADEQIVVDTGSIDNTISIVEKSSAKLYHYQWNDNFAEAKNFALSKASGDWIVFLDADEYFNKETVHKVRKVIMREHNKKNEVDAILCNIINIDLDQKGIELHRFVNLRIFRNKEYLKFHCNVHEGINNEKGKLKILIEKGLEIIHTGYSKNIIEKKLKRNLNLLLEDIKKNGEGIEHYRYLSDCYHGLGEHEKAIYYAQKHIDSVATSVGTEADIYRNLINSMLLLKKNPQEVEPYIKKAMELFPELPDFYAFYAGNLFACEKYLEARPFLEKALMIYNNGYKSKESSVFARILSETYSYLAETFIYENNIEKAMKNIYKSLSDNKFNEVALKQLLLISNKNELEEILRKIYNGKNEYIFLLNTLLVIEGCENAFKYFNKILREEYQHREEIFLEWEMLINADNYLLKNFLLIKFAEHTQNILINIFSSNNYSLYLNKKSEFTIPIRRIVDKYFDNRNKLSDQDYESYSVFLNSIISKNDSNILNSYLSMATDFSIMLNIKIGITLFENKKWTEALNVFLKIVQEIDEYDGNLDYWMGICYFYLSDKENAKLKLKTALEKGLKNNDIYSYLLWLEEE